MIERTNQLGNQWMYTAPASKTNDIVSISAGGFNYDIPFEIYEPTGIVAYQVQGYSLTNEVGVAGAYLLAFGNQLTPTNVSFSAIEVMEQGMISTNATGYFLDPSRERWLNHSLCGADVWSDVNDLDYAGINDVCPMPWGVGGTYSWPIPIYWRVKSEPTTEKYLCTIEQFFSIDSNGTYMVSKFGYTGTCFTNRSHFIIKEIR
jgi:hypothetical protein